MSNKDTQVARGTVERINSVRFSPGRILATPGALEAMGAAAQSPLDLLARHCAGDWGDLEPSDRAANDRALSDGERLLSAYRLDDGERVWVITEWDRSVTTILLPREY
jgi:hypothetical protein